MAFFSRASAAPMPDEIAGVPVRASARARRMALRVEAKSGRVVLTLPQRKSWTAKAEQAARQFVEDNRGWIARHSAATVEKAALVPGAVLEVLGQSLTLRHQAGRGIARIEGDDFIIYGDIAHFERRLRDALKKLAAEKLTALTHEKSARLGLPPRGVQLRDPATRWGSCGPDGRIMYSWRLVLLPPWVMDYIVAHEVAHRVHMNHGRAFWRLCLSLTENGNAARLWLRRNGAAVMRV